MRLLSNLHVKGKPAVLPDRAIRRQSHYFIYRPRMSPNGHFIPQFLLFPRKYMKQELMNGTPPKSNHACHPSGWIQSEKFTQCFVYFIKHTKPTKWDAVILVPNGHYSHTTNMEVITLAREYHVDIITPHHNSHKMQPFSYNLHGAPENILLPRNWKIAPLKPRASRQRLPNRRTIRQCIQRAATGEIMSNGLRVTGLFSCDKFIFRPHDFLLVSEDTYAARVNHPGLVKTSDQSLFNSSNVSLFTSAEALRASDISRVPSLNLQPNTCGGTSKEITSSP